MIEPRRQAYPKNWDAFVTGKSADDIFIYNHILELCRHEALTQAIIVDIILTRLNYELDDAAKRKQIEQLMALETEHQKQEQQLQQEYADINQRMEQSIQTMDEPTLVGFTAELTEKIEALTTETNDLFDQLSDIHQKTVQEERNDFIHKIESDPSLSVIASDGSQLNNNMIAQALSSIPPAPALTTIEHVLVGDNHRLPDEKRDHLQKSCSVMEELRMLSAVFNRDLSPAAFLRAIKLPENLPFIEAMHQHHDEALNKRQENGSYTECYNAYKAKSVELSQTEATFSMANERKTELETAEQPSAPKPFSTRLDRK